MKVALLNRDAGCAKLEKKLLRMNVSVVLSAMTNKAAATLMDLCSLDRVYTFYKMMGFTRNLLDNKLWLQDLQYRTISLGVPHRSISFRCAP